VAENKEAEGGVQEGKDTKTESEPNANQIKVPKSRLDEEIAKRKASEALLLEAKGKQEEAEAQRRKDEAEALAEQGKYKELYETQKAEAEKSASLVTRMKVDGIKKDAATAAGFPDLWNRLSGTTEEEITADAASLAEILPKPKAPSIDGGTTSGKRTAGKDNKVSMNDAQKKYLAGILGVRVEHLPDEVEF
jgi:hypothetical protein